MHSARLEARIELQRELDVTPNEETSWGACLIVMVGAHFNLTEFLDKDRAGMSSTFLTRLRVGETLVDAKGVSRLYNPGVGGRQLALFALVSLILISVVILSLPGLSNLSELVWLKIKVLLGI